MCLKRATGAFTFSVYTHGRSASTTSYVVGLISERDTDFRGARSAVCTKDNYRFRDDITTINGVLKGEKGADPPRTKKQNLNIPFIFIDFFF